jgi:uncharacterized protein DUF4129
MDGGALRRWAPLAAVAVALTGATLAAAYSSPRIAAVPHRPPPAVTAAASGSSASPAASASASVRAYSVIELALPGWLTTGLSLVCAAATIVVVALLLWYVLRDSIRVRSKPLVVDPGHAARLARRTDEVVAALDAGLAGLALGDDPRAVVIACWLRLEEAAAAAGTPRRPGDAPTDLVRRLLDAHQVSRATLDGLAGIYLEARFATHPVDAGTRDAAVAALVRLRGELARPVDPQPATAPAAPGLRPMAPGAP